MDSPGGFPPSSQAMKIGILAQYLDTRPDITELINRLGETHRVVVFKKKGDAGEAFASPRTEIRTIDRRLSLRHKLWNVLFKAFGKIPRSRHNYFITEDFKIRNSPSYGRNFRTLWNRLLLWVNYHLPGWISYDFFIRKMKDSVQADISDVDVFLCYTQIYDDGFLGRLPDTGKPVYVLVYSWDHPCKMKCFSRHPGVRYLVWNRDIENDLVTLQGIRRENISPVGTSQFGYLHDYLHDSGPVSESPGFPYLYFAFSTGTLSLALQEMAVIRRLAGLLEKHWPEARLMLRPYPFFKHPELYSDLARLPNVRLEAAPPAQAGVPDRMRHKYGNMSRASAFLHFGTTLGVEAAFFGVPVIYLSLKEEKLHPGLYYFIHQYQNDAYLHKSHFANTAESFAACGELFQNLRTGEPGLLAYNQALRETFSCESFETYTRRIEKALTEGD